MFRAFTTAAVALARGAQKIILTAEPEEALALRAAGLGELCMGEVGGVRPPGFDFGNSPFEPADPACVSVLPVMRWPGSAINHNKEPSP